MLIPLAIGINSDAEIQQIDLSAIPLLIISYCEEQSIGSVFKQIWSTPNSSIDLCYLITNSQRITQQGLAQKKGEVFLRDEPKQGTVLSRFQLFKNISKEIDRRVKILKSKKSKSFQAYFMLNLWNEKKLYYRFLLIDDVWDILTAKPKTLGLSLMRMIVYGPAVGIHIILGSGISYRNLLQQLVSINPSITNILQAKYGIPEPKRIGSISRELIFNPDGLIFYKKGDEIERYYALRE